MPPTDEERTQQARKWAEAIIPSDLERWIPTLPADASARCNAARERGNYIIESAGLDREKQKKAREEAALLLFDAQAKEYLPLVGEPYCYHTLEVLATTSIQMYGGEDAVWARVSHWRAEWWALHAEHLKATASQRTEQPAPTKSLHEEMVTELKRQANDVGNIEQWACVHKIGRTSVFNWIRDPESVPRARKSIETEIQKGIQR